MTLNSKELAKWGRKGGKAKVPKGFARIDKDRQAEISRQGGKARAAKYQNPNFDKEAYRKRREKGLRGQEPVRTVTGAITPDEHLRRTNPKELKKQQEGGL